MILPGWLHNWTQAIALESLSMAVLVTTGALLAVLGAISDTFLAAVVGGVVGALAGAWYGQVDGAQISKGLAGQGRILRRLSEPSPLVVWMVLLPIVAVCVVWVLTLVDLLTVAEEAGLALGAGMFLVWQLAADSVARVVAFSRTERSLGKRIWIRFADGLYEYALR